MTEEEQLVLVLKVSINMAFEERAAWVGSFTYDRAPGDLPFLFLCSYSISYNCSNICVFTMSVGGLLSWETSGSAEILEEMMESLAPGLEVTTVEGLESTIPVLEVVIPAVGMEVPTPVSETSIPSAITEMTTPMIDKP